MNQEVRDIELDFEEFKALDGVDALKVLVWFMLWLGKYIVKANFLPDQMFIFSKIWKILKDKRLSI